MAISTALSHTAIDIQAESTNLQSVDAREREKHIVNASIVTTSVEVMISSGNKPLAVLLQTAIQNLNEVLEPEFGPDAIQKAAEEGLDVSPEATAQRIVDLSTGFFEAFKQQNPDEDEAVLLERFMDVIGGGIEQGFAEAREILEGLQVLEGEIASNIDRTYELVQQGLQDFFDRMMEMIEGSDDQPEAEETDT